MCFPTITTRNLFGDQVILPEQLSGAYNLLLIAYEPWQWVQIERWRPFANRLAADYGAFNFYEIALTGPSVENGWPFRDQSTQISQYPLEDLPDHSRILVLKTLRPRFNLKIGVQDERQIVTLLVAHSGKILWQNRGPWTPEKADSLDDLLLGSTPLIEDFK